MSTNSPVSKHTQSIIAAHSKGYRVSETGEVFRVSGNQIKAWEHKGYLRFSVKLEGKSRPVMVHRLQAFQKFGPQVFDAGIHVRHLDSNSKNNAYANIAIGSPSQNMMDKPAAQRKRASQIACDANRKHSPSIVREFYKSSGSYRRTMDRFGITSKGTLHYVLNRALVTA